MHFLVENCTHASVAALESEQVRKHALIVVVVLHDEHVQPVTEALDAQV